MNTEKTVLEFNNVTKNYGNLTALKQLNLKLYSGDFLGLVGPNGAGKTTAIHLATGLASLNNGTIKVKGNDVIQDYTRARRLIGLAPQEPNFDRFFSVFDCLTYQGGYFGLSSSESESRAMELLNLFELTDKKDEKPPSLSGGQKRRLLLAKAIIHDPEIIILDEPTAGLDVELRHKLWDYLRKLKKQGKTILLTTHYIEEVEALADRVAILDRGELILEDKISEVMNRYGRYSCIFELRNLDSQLAVRLEQKFEFVSTDNSSSSLRASGHQFDERIHELLQTLMEEDVEIRGLRVDETPLEEIFLDKVNNSG